MFASQSLESLESLEAEVRDLERSSVAAKQRVLQQREGVEATAREIGVAEDALAELGDRFPWHLDTLRMIRERLSLLQQQRDERGRDLRGAEQHLGRWEARVRDCRSRLEQARESDLDDDHSVEVIAQPPRHTLPYGMPPINLPSALDGELVSDDRSSSNDRRPEARAARPQASGKALPRMRFDATAAIESIDAGDGLTLTPDSELMLDVVGELRATVRRLEQDNAQLRARLGSVENNHLYLVKRLREQESDLGQLRDGQRRLEDLVPAKANGDTRDRLGVEDRDDELFSEWDEEQLTPTVEPSTRTLRTVRKQGAVSALDTSDRDVDPELVFDEQFDRDVSALIRLMGKYQVEHPQTAAEAN